MLFTTCKKYPEGGFLRQGPKTLIADNRGDWRLKLYEVNGIDSTNLISSGIDLSVDCFNFFSYKDVSTKKYLGSMHFFKYDNTFLNKNRQISFFEGYYRSADCDSINGIKRCLRNIFCPETKTTILLLLIFLIIQFYL
jgi:hypothetical protein